MQLNSSNEGSNSEWTWEEEEEEEQEEEEVEEEEDPRRKIDPWRATSAAPYLTAQAGWTCGACAMSTWRWTSRPWMR
jgi:hypothetical protein